MNHTCTQCRQYILHACTHPHFALNQKLFHPKHILVLLLTSTTISHTPPIQFLFLFLLVSRQVLCIALPRAAKLMLYSILWGHAMFTFTHPESEEGVGRAAEEEKCSNDDNEEEAEERQHDEKHEDVKKEEVEEERKCQARFVYLGHLCLTSLWPDIHAVSPSLPPSISQFTIFTYCLSTSHCSRLPFPVYFCWLGS